MFSIMALKIASEGENFREKTVSASASPDFFLEILSPSSPILGHNWKHDLARSCFILKLICEKYRDRCVHRHFAKAISFLQQLGHSASRRKQTDAEYQHCQAPHTRAIAFAKVDQLTKKEKICSRIAWLDVFQQIRTRADSPVVQSHF